MAPRDFRTRLARRASKAGLFLSDTLAAAFAEYYELLSRWNRKINLTSLREPDEAIDRLLLEPLAASRFLPEGSERLMDVGSGGGSPAIPLILSVPRLSLTMVESKVRKSAFLREAVRHLGLDAARVENARYEELLTRPELHDAFDAISVRAVRVDPRSLVTLQAFLKPGGVFLLFRGADGASGAPAYLPPLDHLQTVPLIDTTQSHLTLLEKRSAGRVVSVPRGT